MAAIAAAIIAGVGAVASHTQSKKAAASQEKAIEEQRKQESIRAARERAKTVREMRIKRAAIQAGAVNMGVGGSSGELGGVSSVQSQAASQVGFISQIEQSSNLANQYMQDAAGHKSSAATYGAISNVAQGAFTDLGGWKSIFKKTPAPGGG